MEYHRTGFGWEIAGMGAASVRTAIFGGLVTLVAASLAGAQAPERPAVGGIGSPPDAMIFMSPTGQPVRVDRAARTGLPPKAPCNGTPTSG
jgi:hypothetical protein